MHRLFVAIRPPLPVREQLLGLMNGVRGARWQSDEQLHLTLRFVGEVDRHRAEDIAAALNGVSRPPIDIALDGIGSFGQGSKRASLWAGVRPHDDLKDLHKRVDGALLRAAVEPDKRAYLPHITIARLGKRAGPIDNFARDNAGLSGPSFTVRDFCLYESTLGSEGASYEIVERYRLEVSPV